MKYKTASGSNAYAVNWKTDTLSKQPTRRLKRAVERHRQIKAERRSAAHPCRSTRLTASSAKMVP